MALYTVYPVQPNLWAVDELERTTSFIYAGTERALVVDTGFGLANYKQLLAELCPGLPCTVVNTHAHGDHNGGNNQFDEVCCGRFDEPHNHEIWTPESRQNMIDHILSGGPLPEGVSLDGWNPGPSKCVHPMQDGETILLGGCAVEIIEAPGHTPGSICLFDRGNGLLFTGDLILSWEVWGQLPGSVALRYYAQTLNRLKMMQPLVKKVLPAHGTKSNPHGFNLFELPPNVLTIYADGTQSIVDGTVKGEPYRVGEGWREGLCVRFDIGGMAYDPNRI